MPISGRHSNGKTLGEPKTSKVGYFFNRSNVPVSPLNMPLSNSSLGTKGCFFFSFPGTFDLITIYVSSIRNSRICQFVDWECFGMSYYNWFCYLFLTQAWTGLDFCSVWVVVPTQTGGGIRPTPPSVRSWPRPRSVRGLT